MALYRRERSTRLLVVSLVVVSLLTITLDFRGGTAGPFEAGGRAALSVVGSLQEAVSGIFRPVGAFFTGLARIGSLQSRNRELQRQLDELRRLNTESLSLQRENADLRNVLGLKERLQLEGVTGEVIGQSVANYEWSVTIDRGSSDGVRANMPVVAGDGLVGHVVDASANWSKVQLIIDPSSAVAARLSLSRETGLVAGRRNEDLEMRLVDEDARVGRRELVVTSGYDRGLYPPEILIGVVSEIREDATGLHKVVRVRPAVDFSSLETVLIITNH